jgi:hypothetical protein
MAEDSWMKCEREMFLTSYTPKPAMTENMRKFGKALLEKYNAHLVRSLFGESVYNAENLKESIIKSQEAEQNGDE